MIEPNGFSGFTSEMPLYFKLFGGLAFVLIVGSCLFVIMKGLSTWTSNQHAEVLRKKCRVVDKRTEVWGGAGDSSASTNYFITFEFEDHTRKELQVRAHQFGLLVVGDIGELTYQGTRYLDFTRIIENDFHGDPMDNHQREFR